MDLAYVEADVAQLVRVTAAYFDVVAQEKGIEFALQADGVLVVAVDTDKLQRVLLNLLSNAFKFTPEGGRIHVRLFADAAALQLDVADSGPGIPAEHREVVFERFRQLDGGSTRRHSGTGLGLAIARDFVGLHGGTIAVTAAPEGGALFTVRIPRRAPGGAAVTAAPAAFGAMDGAARTLVEHLQPGSDPAANAPAERNRPLVLVVEDNPEMNRFICEILSVDYGTAAAFDGEEGLRQASALRPDLIISDVMMPRMSGDTLLREVQAHPALADTPIVLLTAKADERLRIELLRAGARDYVMKPFAAEEVRARVRNLLDAKLAHERNRQLLVELQEQHAGLGRLTAQLESNVRELEAFSYSVSHDLRAPLRTIDGFSSALLEDFSTHLDAKGRDYVQRIRSAAQRMGHLIDDLLRLSCVGRTELRREGVDLSALASAVADDLARAAPERQVGFVAQSGLVVTADAHLVLVMLENLLGNAWKFTSRTTRPLVELGSTLRDGQLIFFVRDNGVGFDAAHASRLFGAFERLHPESEFPGTGIGLATVRRIIERHGGRIWAEAVPEAGATFFWTLPSDNATDDLTDLSAPVMAAAAHAGR